MEINPENGYILVRKNDMPSYTKKLKAGILGSAWACGYVCQGEKYKCENVIFAEQAGIRLKLRDSSDRIVDFYLVKSEHVVSTIKL